MKIRLMFLCFVAIFVSISNGVCSASDKAVPSKYDKLSVKKVEGMVELGSTITITVKNLKDFLEDGSKDASKFYLYLDWIKIDQINAMLVPSTSNELDGKLRFTIKHGNSPESRSAWAALLGKPFFNGRIFTAPVKVSVGYDKETPILIEPTAPSNTLVIISPLNLFLFLFILVVVLIEFCWLAINTGIIRDPFPDIPTKQRPFSLGRSQMAFWFFLVASSYFFIWLITDNLNSLTGSVLALIGISSVTFLSAAALSSTKDTEAYAHRQKLRKDITGIEATLEEIKKRIIATPSPSDSVDLKNQEMDNKIQKKQLEAELKTLTDSLQSEGFLKDLVSDANGVSLHRFQIAIWTCVLGIIFVIYVLESMAMPEFDTTLLALMGISGGTYIGFKFPVK